MISELRKELSKAWRIFLWIVTDRLFLYSAFRVVHAYWNLLDKVLSLFRGGKSFIHGTKEEQEMARKYKHCAHYVKAIYCQGTWSVLHSTLESSCLYTHISYVHPDCILQDPAATLMGIGKKYAVFSVTSGFDVFNVDEAPFLKMAQMTKATNLYIIPTEYFIKMAEEIPNPTAKIIHINTTARCESTLIVKMFSKMSGVRAFSEPWCFNDIHMMYRKGAVSLPQYEQLLQACYKVLFADDPGKKITHMVAKLTPYAAAQCPIIKEMFPHTAFYYMARGLQHNIKSLIKIIPYVVPFSLIAIKGKFHWAMESAFPYDEVYWWNLMEKAYNGETPLSRHQGIGLHFANMFYNFVKYRDHYEDVLMYEDLITNSRAIIGAICGNTGIDEANVTLALQALNSDAQQSLLGTRGLEDIDLNQDMIDAANVGFKFVGAPMRSNMDHKELRHLLTTTDWSMVNITSSGWVILL